jgi:hypothetical protein
MSSVGVGGFDAVSETLLIPLAARRVVLRRPTIIRPATAFQGGHWMDKLLELEERGWQAMSSTSDIDFFAQWLADDALGAEASAQSDVSPRGNIRPPAAVR